MSPQEQELAEAAKRAKAFQDMHDACPFAGLGGEYIVENGVRRLVSRTGVDDKVVAADNAAADEQRAAVQTSALGAK